MFSPIENTPTREDFMILMSALNKPEKKRVQFAPFVATSCPGPLAFDEVKDLWYTQNDLVTFKYQAKSLASAIRQQRHLPENRLLEESVRGLEHCTHERQKHRYMTIRCTLSAHRRGMEPEKTALVARKCTAWSEEIAFVQACRDFADVYQPQMIALIPAVSSPPEFPFVMKKKKRSADGEHSSRRVRRRVAPLQ